MQTQYKVSVVVITYNPSEEKLQQTLRSILLQKHIAFQIVIADDGSIAPCFQAAEALFTQYGFKDYVIVANPQNRGTVYNVLSGVQACCGEYVKVISPGDMLNGENILHNWVTETENTQAQLSFSDAVCYAVENGAPQLRQGKAYPQTVTCYLEQEAEQIRWNYLIFEDLMLGAAVVCLRQVLLSYLQEISGKVVYAEDNAYRLMAYDGIKMHYFPVDAIIYELGTGISTSGNDVWKVRLTKDWNACTEILLKRCAGKDPLDRALLTAAKGNIHKKAVKLWRMITDKKAQQYWQTRKKLRTTGQVLPEDFLKQISTTKA
ncbi:MAG: glycosyltransferase [Oscillospiraceae bacterium]|nr:glycosyltransferase [Oscillospiraceae bacterium]